MLQPLMATAGGMWASLTSCYIFHNPLANVQWRRFNPLSAKKKIVSENFVCWNRLLQMIALHYWQIKKRSKQHGPRTDCSYRSSLIWVQTVCHRGFLNISTDMKSSRLVAVGASRVKDLWQSIFTLLVTYQEPESKWFGLWVLISLFKSCS